MVSASSLIRAALLLAAATIACGKENAQNPGNPNGANGGVLRQAIGVDLAQVSAFAAVTTNTPTMLHPAAAGVDAAVGADQGGNSGGTLYALRKNGDVEQVPIVESSDPNAQGSVDQPQVTGIFPTASWILFEAPGFQTSKQTSPNGFDAVMCSMIATRRADGALFCAPLLTNAKWAGPDLSNLILGNAAGDVVYGTLSVHNDPTQIDPAPVLYRIMLGGGAGPTAVPAIDFPFVAMMPFSVNGAGDLYVAYVASALTGAQQTKILPVDGTAPFTVQGIANCAAAPGDFGTTDQDTFYIVAGGCGGQSAEGVLRVVTKTGSTFSETDPTLSMPMGGGGSSYLGLYRLADGLYMFSASDMALLKVVADGVVITNPTPTPLTGIDRIVGQSGTIDPRGGFWVFIAQSGSTYEFVRHNGLSQQEIPFAANLDIRSYTASADGAIDFFAFNTDTQEKVHGTIAAGSTEVALVSAGTLDPAQVVAFTQIN